jgi:tetratricopeptide (TPR) repeat protein
VPALGASWLCYVLLVAPVLGLVQSGPQIVADRYSYLPCLPWAALVAALVARLVTSASGKLSPWRASLASLPIVALGVLTWRQIPVWHDSRALWRRALAHDPESFLAHANLGFAFDEAGEIGPAIEQYRNALRRRPGEIRTRHALGLALAKQHDYPAAIVEWRQIIALEPQHVEALYSLGLASARLGRTTDAIAYYRQALAVDPGYLPARNALREITKK